MSRGSKAALVACVAALGLVSASRALPASGGGPAASFVGAQPCAECHKELAMEWHRGRHSKMFQPATPDGVRGDFTKAEIRLRGQRYKLRAEDGRFFITESYLDGQEREHRVDFTLGNRRIQHYLTRLADGWIVVLPPTWDVRRQEWFHNLDIVRPDEDAKTPLQVWNKNCFGCHVSQEKKNYDAATRRYATEWLDFGTNCEKCHGPASRHVERFRDKERFAGDPERYIVRPTRLEASKASAVCAQCHSLRDVVAEGYVPGDDYYDFFLPLLEYGPRAENDPAWWADGRPRRFSNDALGLWQSACYLKGKATCSSCHRDPHEPDVDKSPELLASNEKLCTRCHDAIGKDIAAHTRHKPDGPGSSCVECHMPPVVFSIRAAIRDHSIGVPVPENSVRFGIPNACNVCHKDKKPQWAVAQIAAWGGAARRDAMVRRAEAFTAGRQRKPEAVAKLVAIAQAADAPPLVRANAIGYLSRYREARAQKAVLDALLAEEPVIRAVAALNLGATGLDSSLATPPLVAALRDPRRSVRAGAGFSLVSLGVTRLSGADGERLEAAKADYTARGRFHSDDPQAQLDLGKFLLLSQEYVPAAAAFAQARRLDPAQATDYFEGLLDVLQGQTAKGRARLLAIGENDPYYAASREMLKRLAAQKP